MRTAGTLRVLGALLDYPGERLRHDLPEMRDILREEAALPGPRLDALEALIAAIAAADPLEAQARYVQVFDCARATSLHLFEHVHGESRARGAALADLARTFEASGLRLKPGELPDYLPAVLEFASLQPECEARAFLGEIAHVLNGLHGALRERESPYGEVLAALLELAGEKPRPVRRVAEPPIDETWEEPAAFGPCPHEAPAVAQQPIRFVRNASRGAAA